METIRIGTRDSELAIWQALEVKKKLEKLGQRSVLVPLKSKGDIDLDKPIYEMGITGVFTKTLDIALLNEEIDLAVHSLKDVPTKFPKNITMPAVLKRGDAKDILIIKTDNKTKKIIATGSLRRKAQWLNKYQKDIIVGLRGNVKTRLKKLNESIWDGAIFAKAGIDRLGIDIKKKITLDWMIPAPAQGAITVLSLKKNFKLNSIVAKINDTETRACTDLERDFLQTLEGGCTAPIGGYAFIKKNKIYFKGVLLSENGKDKVEISKTESVKNLDDLGKKFAKIILSNGGKHIMSSLKRQHD